MQKLGIHESLLCDLRYLGIALHFVLPALMPHSMLEGIEYSHTSQTRPEFNMV